MDNQTFWILGILFSSIVCFFINAISFIFEQDGLFFKLCVWFVGILFSIIVFNSALLASPKEIFLFLDFELLADLSIYFASVGIITQFIGGLFLRRKRRKQLLVD